MKAAIYLRISTNEQNIDNQRRQLEEWCHSKGYQISMVEDDTASGTNHARAGRQRIIEASRKGRIDAVICWALDRWGRNAADILLTIDDFHSRGIRFITMTDGLDTGTPAGRMIVGVMSALAQFERERMLERQKAGIQRAKAEGKILGREKRLIDEVKLLELRKEGKSIRAIASIMNIPRSTVADRVKILEAGE